MKEWFIELGPIWQAFIGGLFTWAMTAVGAAFVFFFKEMKRRLLDAMLGFAAGVMLAASFWSLLLPAIELSKSEDKIEWFVPALGILVGCLALLFIEKLIPHLNYGKKRTEAEGIPTKWNKSILLVLAITLHNIPEGLALGVSFGAASLGLNHATIGAGIALAIGIGIQNLPEGSVVSVPLRGEGLSQRKSFFYGQLSGSVEPVFAVLGAYAVISMTAMLPFSLSFAAGAMIYVVVKELIPESHAHGNIVTATFSTILGFIVMMILDVTLG